MSLITMLLIAVIVLIVCLIHVSKQLADNRRNADASHVTIMNRLDELEAHLEGRIDTVGADVVDIQQTINGFIRGGM